MAHANIDERRKAVSAHYRSGGDLTPEFKKRMAAEFSCSTTAIYLDWMSINQSIHGGRMTTTPLIRREIFARDNGTCQYCGVPCVTPVVEHIVPASKGGPTAYHNLVTACPKCNARKGNNIWVPMNLDDIADESWASHIRDNAQAPVKKGAPKRISGCTRVSALIDDDSLAKLRAYAELHQTTQSEVIRYAIQCLPIADHVQLKKQHDAKREHKPQP